MKILVDVMDKDGVKAAEMQAKIRDIFNQNNLLQSEKCDVKFNEHTQVFHITKRYLPIIEKSK